MFDPRPYLDRLEALCEPAHVKTAEARQLDAYNWGAVDRRPTIITCHDSMRHIRYDRPPNWPEFPRSLIIQDVGRMLIAELTDACEGALLGDDRAYTIRPDYGAVIIPSLFGCRYIEKGDEMPWLEPLADARAIEALVDADLPGVHAGLGARVEETAHYFLDALRPYEKLRQIVHVGCPDTQSPFNLAASIIGSNIYLALYDTPEIVHRLLQKITDICLKFTRFHKQNVGEAMDRSYIMGWCTEGGIRIVDDSAVNLSEEMYREFCVPYNVQLSRALGGFLGHFCGAGRQILEAMLDTPGIRALNLGNPEMQDWDRVTTGASRNRVVLLWDGHIPPAGQNVTAGTIHKHIVHTWSQAMDAAKRIREEY